MNNPFTKDTAEYKALSRLSEVEDIVPAASNNARILINTAIYLNKLFKGKVPDKLLDILNMPLNERYLINDINSLEAIREGLEQSKSGATKSIDLTKFAGYEDVDEE